MAGAAMLSAVVFLGASSGAVAVVRRTAYKIPLLSSIVRCRVRPQRRRSGASGEDG